MKALGWRFSPTRDAWVHRFLRGRIGPVFQGEGSVGLLNAYDEEAFESLFAPSGVHRLPADDAEPLPQRLARGERVMIPVEVRLAADEPPRLVHVDGRPPMRGGIMPTNKTPMAGKVVPIKKAHASAWG